MIYYGNELIDCGDMCNSVMFLQAINYPNIISGFSNLTVSTITYYNRRHFLLNLLHLTIYSKASEPRNKIFVLSDLLFEDLELENYLSLKSDYGKSIVEIYVDIIHHLVRNSYNGHNLKLGVLSLVQYNVGDMANSEN
jgi:hypothetical protein